MRAVRIVLTGGPGAGKTTVAQALVAAKPNHFALVPEAATQVYQQLQTNWSRLDLAGRRDLQHRIYRLQLEQESRIAAANPGKTLLLDRGTVDGAAYWPDGPGTFWKAMETTWADELSRYDAVIWMQTIAARGLYETRTNPVRHENPQAAIEIGRKLEALWQRHARFHRVETYAAMRQKVAAVAELVEALAGRTGKSRTV
jgi:predicted ATPase